jgi:hypothetical protein
MAEWSASNELERLCRQYLLNQSHYTEQQHIENHNVEVTKIKISSKIFSLSHAFWCPTWRGSCEFWRHSAINLHGVWTFNILENFKRTPRFPTATQDLQFKTTDNTDRKAMYHAPLFQFPQTYLFLRGYVVFNFLCNFPPAKLNSASTLYRLALLVFYNRHEWPHHFLNLLLTQLQT